MKPTRSRLGAASLLFGVLVVGGLIGGLLVGRLEPRQSPTERGRGGGRDGYVERLTAHLDLTGPQQDAIRGILQRSEPVMDSIWRDVRPRFDSLRNVVRDSIRAQLTPEQLQKYTDMLERRDREYRTRRSNGKQ